MKAVEEVGRLLADISIKGGEGFKLRGAWALFLQGSTNPLPSTAEAEVTPQGYAAIRDHWEVEPGDLFGVIKTPAGGQIRLFVV